MSSCERPWNSSARDLVPSAVSKLYSFSTATHGSSRRFRASSSLRRVSSFSAASSSSRAACHSSCVPTLCCVIALSPVSARVPPVCFDTMGGVNEAPSALRRRQPLGEVLERQRVAVLDRHVAGVEDLEEDVGDADALK